MATPHGLFGKIRSVAEALFGRAGIPLPEDPSLLLRDLDLEKRTATFVPMTRETYADSPFHDRSVRPADKRKFVVDLDELFSFVESVQTFDEQPLHLVFHTAYCCSTVLTRYLDALGCFTLREPRLLLFYSDEFVNGGEDASGLAQLARVLLTNTWSGDHAPVAKPTNACNVALGPILDLTPGGRGLFLYNPCRDAILSYLQRPDWTRAHASTIVGRAGSARQQLPGNVAAVNVEQLSDAEAAAYLWLVNIYFYLDMARGPLGPRIRSLVCDTFLARPADTLARLVEHLALDVSPERVREVADGDILRRHGKDPARKFTPASRQEKLEETYREQPAEVDAALEWITKMTRQRPVSDSLPRPLLEL